MSIGIIGMEFYSPNTFVSQEDLEESLGIEKGKFTKGLGQDEMAFCDLSEDIVSMSMTALENLIKRYKISSPQIGRLEIGTETIIDKSKSVKTGLMGMEIFKENTNIEGVDNINACYGGTAALFNSVEWLKSLEPDDNRYAIVITGDIAVYEEGPARPTGGAGVIAILLGKDAPIVLEKHRWTHMENAYDFYKPNLESEYPVVDGVYSNKCYLNSLEICYKGLRNKWLTKCTDFNISNNFDYALFHMPYTKLVNKAFVNLYFIDWISGQYKSTFLNKFWLMKCTDFNISNTFDYTNGRNSNLIYDPIFQKKILLNLQPEINKKLFPSQILGKRIGNIYSGSLYLSLLSLICSEKNKLQNSRVLD